MVLPLFLTLPIILIILLACYITIQRLKFNLPPGPRPWPIVGNLYQIKSAQCQCFYEWAQIYGPIISVWFGSKLFIVVSNSKLAEEVLKENDQELANRLSIKSKLNFARNGMDLTWADYGPHYVKVRKACTLELFTIKKIEAFKPIRKDEVTAMIESIYNYATTYIEETHERGVITLRNYVGETALNHITRIILGKRFINSKGEFEGQLGREFMSILLEMKSFKGPNMLMLGIQWLQQLLFDQAINKHEDRLGELAKKIMENDNKRHFVDALVSYKDEYDLSDDTIIGLLWDMIIAGKDTIAIVVEWAMAELIRHPRVLQKAQYELNTIIIGQERIMTEEDFPSLPYLQAIVKEALRLHPPTPLLLPHRAQTHVKIGGYDVPKDTIVFVNIWALGREPSIWPNPLEFWPERFLENDIDIKGHDFWILPFGAGRRVCPGAQLGLNLVTLMLGHLLHHFDWDIPTGTQLESINMSEAPGIVTYMASPLQLVPIPKLPRHLYKRICTHI